MVSLSFEKKQGEKDVLVLRKQIKETFWFSFLAIMNDLKKVVGVKCLQRRIQYHQSLLSALSSKQLSEA